MDQLPNDIIIYICRYLESYGNIMAFSIICNKLLFLMDMQYMIRCYEQPYENLYIGNNKVYKIVGNNFVGNNFVGSNYIFFVDDGNLTGFGRIINNVFDGFFVASNYDFNINVCGVPFILKAFDESKYTNACNHVRKQLDDDMDNLMFSQEDYVLVKNKFNLPIFDRKVIFSMLFE